jgi:hypothetical protein
MQWNLQILEEKFYYIAIFKHNLLNNCRPETIAINTNTYIYGNYGLYPSSCLLFLTCRFGDQAEITQLGIKERIILFLRRQNFRGDKWRLAGRHLTANCEPIV